MALRKCACIDTLYTELPFIDRFEAAKKDGFESIEFWDWRTHNLDELRRAAQSADISISGFNGDADFSMIDPSQKEQYLGALRQSIMAAQRIGAASVTIHSNALGPGGSVINHYDHLSHTVKLCSMFGILTECAEIAEQSGIRMHLEALNTTADHKGNFLRTTQMGAEICRLIGSPNLKLLYDVYHMSLNEGGICDHLTAYIDQIGHVHIADAPGRHEPGTGEINYKNVIEHLKNIGYKGRLGYELFPKNSTAAAIAAIMRAL